MSRVTWAVLNIVGKCPLVKERLARLQIIGANISAHPFKIDVGMKSIGDDFDDMELKILWTSSGVTKGRSFMHSPSWSLSDENGLIVSPTSLFGMDVLMFMILSRKNSAMALQKLMLSSGCLAAVVLFASVCSRFLACLPLLSEISFEIRSLMDRLWQSVMMRFVERHERRYSILTVSSPERFHRFSKWRHWRLALTASGVNQRFDFGPFAWTWFAMEQQNQEQPRPPI